MALASIQPFLDLIRSQAPIFKSRDFSVLDEKINGEFRYMRVLVLGGSTASVQAGHQVTLCTPYYALGEDAAGSLRRSVSGLDGNPGGSW